MALLLLEETITQLLFVILVSPLFAGIMAKFKSRVESRKGQSIFQPYYDIAKYMRKETLIPAGSSSLFLYLPYISFGVYCLIALIIPVLIPAPIYFTASADFLGGAILFTLAGFLKMVAAIDTRNNFSAMSVSRIMSFTFLGEGTLITVFFAVSLITGTNNPYVTSAYLVDHPLSNLTLVHVFATLAFFMIFLYETGKIPLESSGLHELGMIDEGMNYEYSGKLLAINKWSSYMKQYLLGSVLLNVFLIPWGLTSGASFLLDLPVMFGKWLILIAIIVIIETSLSKIRLFKIVDFLAAAFTFSILFLFLTELIP